MSSVATVLQKVNSFFFFSYKIDEYCEQEKVISDYFCINNMCSKMQDCMIQCILESKVDLNLVCNQFAQLLHMHLEALFPQHLDMVMKLYQCAVRFSSGVQTMAKELKQVLIQQGQTIYKQFQTQFKSTTNPVRCNWEYVSTLAKHYYSCYQVLLNIYFKLDFN